MGIPTEVKLIVGAVVAVVALILLVVLWPITRVETGQMAVITRGGAVTNTVGPGYHLIAPVIGAAIKFDTQTQKEEAQASAASSDLQTVSATVAVNYNIDPTKVADLYTRLGLNFSSTVIDPSIQEVTKAVTAKYTAEQLITQRAQVTSEIQAGLTERLAPSDIIVTAVSITNFDFSGQFNAAIEAKVTAEQNAQAAKNKLDQVTYEAQQTVVAAKAQAESIQIQAQAINSQGGADYVMLQAIKQWNGVLPAQQVPGSAVPFLGKL